MRTVKVKYKVYSGPPLGEWNVGYSEEYHSLIRMLDSPRVFCSPVSKRHFRARTQSLP